MIRLPDNTHRLAVIGRTGSGKTQAGAWHLSRRDLADFRWIVFDFKRDQLLNDIEKARHIEVGDVPKHRGLYIVHPMPDDVDGVEKHLWSIWERENTGIYIDEGYMIGNSKAFRAILTQGRSKRVPAIVLSQRPVWLTRFVWSEADFFQVFQVTIKSDKDMLREYVPCDFRETIPRFHSIYYDVGNEHLVLMQPVPDRDAILEAFDDRLSGRRIII